MRLVFQSRRSLLPAQAAPPVWAVVALGRAMPRWVVWLIVFSCLAFVFGAASPASGQAVNNEYKLKAAYLYKFGTYIEWPKGAFRDEASPFVIGILGPDPVGAGLRKIAKVKKIGGRKIEVRNFQRTEEVRGCQILFISRALNNETQQAAVKLLSKRNILLVGETPVFLNQGGVINFVIQANRIQIHISKAAYQRENLKISARLLQIAKL